MEGITYLFYNPLLENLSFKLGSNYFHLEMAKNKVAKFRAVVRVEIEAICGPL